MIAASRRSFITGLVALVAAPTIVRAGSLMAVNSGLVPGNTLLTRDQIMREAVQLFWNSNLFIERMNAAYDEQFPKDDAKIGDVLSIRLPNDYVVSDGPGMHLYDSSELTTMTIRRVHHETADFVPPIPDSLALAAAAVAVAPAVLAKPMTRRFWGK